MFHAPVDVIQTLRVSLRYLEQKMPNMVTVTWLQSSQTQDTDFVATAKGPTGIIVSIYRYPNTHLEREIREYPDGDSCLLSPGILLATGFSRRVKTISDGPSPDSYRYRYWYTQTIGEAHERRRRGSEARQNRYVGSGFTRPSNK